MRLSIKRTKEFQEAIQSHYQKHKRDFPWRRTRGSYAILVSEVMLQQTQAERVVPFFNKWMKEFPTVKALAKAPLKKVLQAWSGLGYNRRALNLKRAAEMIVKDCNGKIPRNVEKIDALPGVGPYTAGAVAAFAWNLPVAFVETNIRSVYLHFFFKDKKGVKDEEILNMIKKTMPVEKRHPSFLLPSLEGRRSVREWYNALMDYGAMLKETVGNPNVQSARYAKQSRFKGSHRELRGKVLKSASEKSKVTLADFKEYQSEFSIPEIFSELVSEGFLKKKGASFFLA